MSRITDRLEDYLVAILSISEEKRVARSRDIAKVLDVHTSTVTAALQSLAELDLINYERYQFVTLTDAGRKAALKLQHKHAVLARFLNRVLHVEQKEAEENAHRMEHVVSDVVLSQIASFAHYIESCPRQLARWQLMDFSCEPDERSAECRECGRALVGSRE